MSKFTEKKLLKLQESIDWSERQLAFPRKQRVEAIRMASGTHYAEGGSSKKVPVNHLKMAIDIHVRILAPRVPRVMVTTKDSSLRPTAENLALAVNQIPAEIGLQQTFRRFVTEALYSIGILKCGLHAVGEAMGQQYGSQFVDNVPLDDYFLDMSAKRRDQIQYEGNSYWLDYEKVMDAEWVERGARDFLKPDEHTTTGIHGEERADAISVNENASVFRDRIWLRDVWLPDEKIFVTMGITSKKILNEFEWDGPKNGPYVKLGFTDIPGGLLPLAPVQTWRDIHELSNSIFRKLGNQADGEKSVLGFSGSDDEGVQNFKKAMDGEGITYNGPKPEKLVAGGVNQTTLAYWMQLRELASYLANNIDSLGGLSQMSETVGQDQLMSESANAQVQDMSDNVVDATKTVFETLAHYEWNDPVKRRTLEKSIEGTDGSIQVGWGPESKLGKFEDYDIDIDVYSRQDNSPSVKLQKLGAIMQSYVLPLMPLIEQSGGVLDIQKLLRLVSKYSDMDEIKEVITFVEPGDMNKSDSPGKPASTTRNYVRTGKPGMSQQGASATLQQQLLSQDQSGEGG